MSTPSSKPPFWTRYSLANLNKLELFIISRKQQAWTVKPGHIIILIGVMVFIGLIFDRQNVLEEPFAFIATIPALLSLVILYHLWGRRPLSNPLTALAVVGVLVVISPLIFALNVNYAFLWAPILIGYGIGSLTLL